MKIRYSVTFEFDSRAPMTHRGTVEAGSVHVCMGKAVKQAKKALQPTNWTSLVCILDKLGFQRLEMPTAEPSTVGTAA